MLPDKPDSLRVALNRVTFGARDTDVAYVRSIGWNAWLNEQFYPPAGDDADLAVHMADQTMPIAYAAADPTSQGSWDAVSEDRPLNYINADIPTLWHVASRAGREVAPAERNRTRQELAAATWIRNAHSRYQLREFMVDFWHNHFNVGKDENQLATTMLPAYDRLAIRPHVFGNFRTMLEANATSPAMLIYLDNWQSNAVTPNENYAREIMELHTMGTSAYLGVGTDGPVPTLPDGRPAGFTDQDVIHASRALSGWTIRSGQRVGGTSLGSTGEFVYNAAQHHTGGSVILGENIAGLSEPQAQGLKFLDLIASHPATATFIVGKLCRRIFGDAPPAAAIARGVAAWTTHAKATDQIRHVLRAILADGDEVLNVAPAKVRRPYERLLALVRTTDMIVNARTSLTSVLDPLKDGLFAWQAPNGRPDVDGFWLATGATLTTWNLLLQMPSWPQITTSLADQTPLTAQTPTAIVEYWLERMIGAQLPSDAMSVLIADQSGRSGVAAARQSGKASTIELACRRLVSLIATTEQFTLR